MQPDTTLTWDEFAARQTGEEFAAPSAKQRKRPKEAASVAGLLLEAIQVAGTRRGRRPQAERVREQVLLEVLTAAIRRAR